MSDLNLYNEEADALGGRRLPIIKGALPDCTNCPKRVPLHA